jgi:uncharacterized membrane protein (UPF0127 family)
MKRTQAGARAQRASLIGAVALTLAWALALAGCQAPGQTEAASDGWVSISGDRVPVEIARNPEEQSRGLGERNSLAWGHGMLFVYDKPNFPRFWMKGMRFDIDIVWILGDRIVEISHRVPHVPGENGPTLMPRSLTDRVLEVSAGFAQSHAWRAGQRVEIEIPSPLP